MEITIELVKTLINEQFPQWSDLEIYPVTKNGHDNRTFHLGKNMSIRLPSEEAYAIQVMKENKWLPYLQKHLDYPISKPLVIGKPNHLYPYPWLINQWIEGETLLSCTNVDKTNIAVDLSLALQKLQAIDCQKGPKAGLHNFYRGADLKVYHQETITALNTLSQRLPTDILFNIWQNSIATTYCNEAVWVHGDIAPGNILLKENRFYALIDFGILSIGDPACDFAMAWSYFDDKSRPLFLRHLSTDLICRARGWALWKALITYDDTNPDFAINAKRTIHEILNEYYKTKD